jgi:hypothetical protein
LNVSRKGAEAQRHKDDFDQLAAGESGTEAVCGDLVSAVLGDRGRSDRMARWIVGCRWGWMVAGPMVAVAVAIGIVGLIWPRVMRPIFVGWMCAAFPIGWVVSHFLLAAVFYLIITPLGLVMRLAGRDKLKLQIDRESKTYWTRRPSIPPASRYFRQF